MCVVGVAFSFSGLPCSACMLAAVGVPVGVAFGSSRPNPFKRSWTYPSVSGISRWDFVSWFFREKGMALASDSQEIGIQP
jgi:hypothetical protein